MGAVDLALLAQDVVRDLVAARLGARVVVTVDVATDAAAGLGMIDACVERGGKHEHMQKLAQEVGEAQLPLPGTHCH